MDSGTNENLGPYLKLARNLGIVVLLFLTLGFFVEREREKNFPRKELARFEQRFLEPVLAKNYKRYGIPRSRGGLVILLTPARWNDGKTEVYQDQSIRAAGIEAAKFSDADTIFYVRDGTKTVDQNYTMSGKVKRVKVKQATIETLAFDRSGTFLGYYYRSSGSPAADLVFTREGDTPEISSGFSSSPLSWIADLPQK